MVDNLTPFDFFRQETSHHDVVAMNQVIMIATLMSADKVRNELLPYLQSIFKVFKIRIYRLIIYILAKLNDMEQVLVVLAKHLGYLASFVGNQHLSLLIPLMEGLASQEETVVRVAATNSCVKILSTISPG